MKRFFLLSLLAVGCAHAPHVETAKTETVVAADTVRVIREGVRGELLAAGPASELSLFLLLNGEPSKLGVLTSTGSSVDNTTTAVPFSVTAGWTLLFKCDAGSANVGGGSTCDTSVTGANHKIQLGTAWEPYFMVLNQSSTVCLDAPAATTINCAVFRMK